MNNFIARGAVAASVALLAIPLATPAAAQATRTWVSGVGDDANPCSRTAPCRTFAGSISKTAAGGEINCLDPVSVGAVTITKSIKLYCDDIPNGALVSASSAITINAGANDIIVLSGLSIEGLSTGLYGIRVLGGGGVHIRNTNIRGFKGGNSYAVAFTPNTTGATLVLDNVTIVNNGAANNSGGILVQPANNVSASFAIDNSKISDIGGMALRVDLTGTTGTIVKGTVTNSVFADAGTGIFVKAPAGTGTADVLAKGNVFSGGQNGITGQDVGATVSASGNVVTLATAYGVRSLAGAALISYGDNEVTNNGNNGAFTATVGKQ